MIAVLGLLVLTPACGKTIDPPAGTNTNWLGSCEDDGDCSNGNECICGVCTRLCSGASQCAALDKDANCTPVAECGVPTTDEPSGQSACLLGCRNDGDCGAVANGECRDGVCLPRTAVGGAAGSSAPRPDASTVPPGPDGGAPFDPYALVRADNVVEIGAAYLDCEVDKDCTLVGIGCDGCCQAGAIDADLRDTYDERFALACADYRGGICDCDAQPTLAKCVAGTCRAVQDCFSPAKNWNNAYDVGAIGCPCDQPDDAVCIGNAALVCAQRAGHYEWTGVEDGPCEQQPDACVPQQTFDDPTQCLALFTTCRELPDGKFCGEGCMEPFDCSRISCANYAPLDPSECLAGLQVTEGLCDEGKIRYRSAAGGFFAAAQYWNAATGALLAEQALSDTPSYCDNTSFSVTYGDKSVIDRCQIEAPNQQICPRQISDCEAQPFDCQAHSCDIYAPFDPADCNGEFFVQEGDCPGVKSRVHGFGTHSRTYWWAADTGALLAFRFSSDQKDFCKSTNPTYDLIYGDPEVVMDCPGPVTSVVEYCNR